MLNHIQNSQVQKVQPASCGEEKQSNYDSISTLMPPSFSVRTSLHEPGNGIAQRYANEEGGGKPPFYLGGKEIITPEVFQNRPIQMNRALDFLTSVAEGIYSVGEDIVGGAYRTARGLNLFDQDELSRIGAENERAYRLIVNIFENRDLLGDIIRYTMQDIYNRLPPDQQQQIQTRLQSAAETGAGYVVGRLVIGSAIARTIATRIASRIAASQGYRMVATRLGVSAGAGATGIGIPITLLMVQGVLERAGQASRRLQSNYPELYRELYRLEIEMGWFLVEPHFEEIRSELIQ